MSIPEQTPTPSAADVDAFKQAFRRLAAGVSVVTAVNPDGRPVGFTATSLASLAADPPLATFNMARVSSAWRAIDEGDYVAIHMLGAGNRALAEMMSGDNALRFDGDHWALGSHGLPILKGVPAVMIARIIERHPVHRNAVIVVQIEEGAVGASDEALLYHERRYLTPGGPA